MEEKKETKEVKMGVVKGQDKEPMQKLSYEDLNKVCGELSEQNQQMRTYIRNLRGQIQQMAQNDMLARLGYMFEVLKYKELFDSDFVLYCTEEIKAGIIIPEEQPEEEKKEAKKE